MTNQTEAVSAWDCRRNHTTREIERLLLDSGFEKADAYQYNPASIRLRVVDSRFHRMPGWERVLLVKSVTNKLPGWLRESLRLPVLLSTVEYQKIKEIDCAEVMRNYEFEFPSGGT
jgi:hypothetical protein